MISVKWDIYSGSAVATRGFPELFRSGDEETGQQSMST